MGKPVKGVQKPTTPETRKKKVSDLLSSIEEKLKREATKASLADFIRLTQLERELEAEEQPREIIIRWVESTETDDIGE